MINNILWNHDLEKPIGKFTSSNGALFMEFNQETEITMEMVFNSFHGGGFIIIEQYEPVGPNEIEFVKILQVVELSIIPELSDPEFPKMGNGFGITSDNIMDMELELAKIKGDYLRLNGWKESCKNPKSVWTWMKKFGDTWCSLNMDEAVEMQRCDAFN